MTTTQIDFDRITQAIEYINLNFRLQPPLDEVAEHVHLSPMHFQRMFSQWAGVSPKKFLQYTSLNYAKHVLKGKKATLFDTAIETGLSGSGRLHDLFVSIEAMTPAEYKNGGVGLNIKFSFHSTQFGPAIVASTEKGICHLAFYEDENEAIAVLKHKFPAASLIEDQTTFHIEVLRSLHGLHDRTKKLKFHLKGTPFQLKVWEALLKIPFGELSTYGKVASAIDSPKASRAVGTAIGDNPIAVLIPCHRVIQASGAFGGYMWGSTRKQAIIGWEAAKINA